MKVIMPPEVLNSWEFFRSVLDGIQDMIKILDRDYKIIYANRSAQAHIAKPLEEIVGNPCYQEYHQSSLPPEYCLTPDTFQSGDPQNSTFSTLEPDGLERHWEISTFPLKDEAGNIKYIIEIVKDITERKRLEDQLVKAERLAGLGHLAAGIAHELRNPLVGIGSIAQLLDEDTEENDPRKGDIHTLIREIKRLDKFITEFLDFSAPKGPDPSLCELSELIQDTLALLDKQISSNKINIIKKFPKDIPKLLLDRDQMKQVFLNIIVNAMEAMAHGGELEITMTPALPEVYNRSTKSIEAKCPSTAKGVVIEFRDTGCGIPPDKLKRIFDPFFSYGKKGTGLGLSICHKIVKSHLGKIEVESQLNQWTRVKIWLPV
jgi:PAS domain S-box-containing protein